MQLTSSSYFSITAQTISNLLTFLERVVQLLLFEGVEGKVATEKKTNAVVITLAH